LKNANSILGIYGTPVGDITQLKADGVDLKRLAEEGVIIFPILNMLLLSIGCKGPL
jgi:predicted unusual protein kinase regulating ubiquinone biosynthesis (AarF/ABC1/UbiB family)